MNKRCRVATQSTTISFSKVKKENPIEVHEQKEAHQLVSLSRAKEENPIVLKVQRQKEGDHLWYRMSRNTTLRYLMLDYCDRTGADFCYTRFHLIGSRLKPDKAADDLGMENEDIIDAFSYQSGGGSSPSTFLV